MVADITEFTCDTSRKGQTLAFLWLRNVTTCQGQDQWPIRSRPSLRSSRRAPDLGSWRSSPRMQGLS